MKRRPKLAELAASHRLRVPRIVDGAQGPDHHARRRARRQLRVERLLGLAATRGSCARRGGARASGAGRVAFAAIVGNQRETRAARDAAPTGSRRRRAGCSTRLRGERRVLTALLRAGDVVYSDELNHASIVDGCRLSRASSSVVPPAIWGARGPAREGGGRRRLVVSVSLFSMDGDLADVAALAALAKRLRRGARPRRAQAIGVPARGERRGCRGQASWPTC